MRRGKEGGREGREERERKIDILEYYLHNSRLHIFPSV